MTSVATNAPTTSTLNFPAHDTRANAVTVPLGTGGKLGFTYVGKSGSSAEIVFDVTGYFLPGASGASYFGVTPSRLLNPTVLKTSVAKTVQVTGVAGIPDGAIAVTGNLTVVNPASAGYVSVTSVATNAPTTSTLNFPAHDTRANAVTVPLGAGGKLGFTYVGKTGSTRRDRLRRDRLLPARRVGRQLLRGDPEPPAQPDGPQDVKVAKTVQVDGRQPNPAMAIPDGAIAVTGNLTVVNPLDARLPVGDQRGDERAQDLDAQLPDRRHAGQRRHDRRWARVASSASRTSARAAHRPRSSST